ncbi:hypothetical protein G1C96_1914 [Bifidobacterium sp. DSM 109958]|uniref:Uncharacterized protein n=1 Tax=Bifidobacterium moraviense TaxID=2675323 RepID=A0A7Y0F3G1_9BIFI|nr:hypothetical protein [Bifidobacterium sp. DSM 109958]NMN01325.1 hypothetical protein [Bifidobacterium sp. DSM 109958]
MTGPTTRIRRALDMEIRPDVNRHRADANDIAIDCLRAIANALQAGRTHKLRINVPTDPADAAILGASLMRLAANLADAPQTPEKHSGKERDAGRRVCTPQGR